jgi:hypothetical protein
VKAAGKCEERETARPREDDGRVTGAAVRSKSAKAAKSAKAPRGRRYGSWHILFLAVLPSCRLAVLPSCRLAVLALSLEECQPHAYNTSRTSWLELAGDGNPAVAP